MTPKEILLKAFNDSIRNNCLSAVVVITNQNINYFMLNPHTLHNANSGYLRLDDYDDNLMDEDYDENSYNFCIKRILVIKYSGTPLKDLHKHSSAEVLWSRRIKLTKKDIAKKFNIDEEDLEIIL